jgi:hypothetical protein
LQRETLINQILYFCRTYIKITIHQQRDNQAQLENQVATLTQELTQARGELANLRIEKEELELKADAAPSLERKDTFF